MKNDLNDLKKVPDWWKNGTQKHKINPNLIKKFMVQKKMIDEIDYEARTTAMKWQVLSIMKIMSKRKIITETIEEEEVYVWNKRNRND
jgi:hypothetical protein